MSWQITPAIPITFCRDLRTLGGESGWGLARLGASSEDQSINFMLRLSLDVSTAYQVGKDWNMSSFIIRIQNRYPAISGAKPYEDQKETSRIQENMFVTCATILWPFNECHFFISMWLCYSTN